MEPPRTLSLSGPVLVDAHVHFYRCYRPEPFLDGALANFRRLAARLGLAPQSPGILCLTETAEDDWFRSLRDGVVSHALGRWTVHPTEEDGSLIARRGEDDETLVLIAGRQIAAREGLEVLAIGMEDDLPDGQPLRRTIERVLALGGVPVVPWGFGKWWFRRGRIVRELIERPPRGRLFLGDNGGRPREFGDPPLFAYGRRRGIWTLPGSDPLPFPSHERRAGSNGFVLDGTFDLTHPCTALKERLRTLAEQPPIYGEGEAVLPFLRHQVLMQLRKRARPPRRMLSHW